ncbi:MAG: hypothetical protein IT166_07580 [Bryobacterales bacterium]|nr:hypothetical protein [Bryobacterales bacterium]
MKPKNKEVNIFNMSLLDILCGALGAFCFMMLVLFQYWKPESPYVKKAKVDTAQLEQKLSDLMKQMKNMSNLSPEAVAQLQQMQRDFAALQSRMATLKAQVQQSQAQAEAYRKQADDARKQTKKLEVRNPIVVGMSTLTRDHDVDLYVKDSKMEEADPRKQQGAKWPGDVFFNAVKGPSTDVWLMRDVPAGEYKIYYKFVGRNGNPAPAQVGGYYMQYNSLIYLPVLTLNQEPKAVYVGSIMVQQNYDSGFKVAPEFEKIFEEQREQRKRRQPPPPPKQ